MADEDLSVAPEPAAPTIPEPQAVEEPTAIPDPVDPDNQAEPNPEPEEELEDFEWNGKPYKGPKGLKDGVLMRADYTKKTTEVAERGKALDAREAQIEQRLKATDEELDARADLRVINKEIERFKDYDYAAYQAHHREDPMGANEAWTYKQDLLARKADREGVIGRADKERSAKAQQEAAKRWQETAAYAAKEIPGWSKETAQKVLDYAEQRGVPADFLEANISPVMMDILYDGMIGRQTRTTPLAAQPQQQTQPLKVVSAKSNPSNVRSLEDLAKAGDKASMDAFAAKLNEKLAKRAGR